ncbi:hypothetical protein [Streptomyces phytohabitans]|uniref:hypothetical protein n=1 Tax=Streptomyces phytohabitans TaxID=1150371 RepID=UPI00345B9A68
MNRTTAVRPVVAGLLALGVLGTGAAGAHAAAADAVDPGNELITARSDAPTVKTWEEFRVQGRTEGVRPGYTVLLQQKQGAEWKALPVSTVVNRDGSYRMRVKLGMRGENQLRTVTGRDGTVVSAPMTVEVR